MTSDILGPFPVTTKCNRYVPVLMDYFTKWPEGIPDQEASTVAEEFVRSWISCYGVPMILHSDQGTNFNSALLTELCKRLGILKSRTTVLHPESDEMTIHVNIAETGDCELYVLTSGNCLSRFQGIAINTFLVPETIASGTSLGIRICSPNGQQILSQDSSR
ncbi:hypothetical protein AVEN_8792-1 [Araneus ventricosus]|uniref:Integrase catalytic domain-containing protein n=1 Tax=Araneus ventricosus TaxID=182803 RepID=A0A4Y2XA08_ARAVE|nr:hypothetical protein AVEN_8792-1 [Araneus ventricosus]